MFKMFKKIRKEKKKIDNLEKLLYYSYLLKKHIETIDEEIIIENIKINKINKHCFELYCQQQKELLFKYNNSLGILYQSPFEYIHPQIIEDYNFHIETIQKLQNCLKYITKK